MIDDASVVVAARAIEADGGLNVLVNNAGIEERTPGGGFIDAKDMTAESVRTQFDTDVLCVVCVLHAFLPLLESSSAPVVLNVSSGLSLTRDLGNPMSPTHFYPGITCLASKAALNMVTVQYAKALPGIRINAVDPGFTATDLNHNTGSQAVVQGAEVIVRIAQISQSGPSGGFFDPTGSVAR